MTATATRKHFSPQFWLMFAGLVISSTGTTMIWPFLMIYASERLGLPLTSVTSLMSINSIAGLISSILAGSLVDRFGRKGVMAVGLFGHALVYLAYIPATQYWHFAILMVLAGVFNPLFRVGSDAMLADMFSPEERTQAFAVVRMGRNIGVALGPVLGGLVLSVSYSFGMYAAALALGTFGLITVLFLKETNAPDPTKPVETLTDQLRVFHEALQNTLFTRLIGAFTLMEVCGTLMWSFLAVYLKQNFGINETRYSWIPTTNALMVVFLQLLVTRQTQKYPTTHVLPAGAAFYAASMLILGLSNNYWGFWAGMVVMTIGELITAPTATSFVANLAPPDKRGRYLGLFGLTWNIAMAIGPFGAGILTDNVSMRAPWYAGALAGLASVLAFISLDRLSKRSQVNPN
ncbi:MAG: MDR family MFS transporter [Anaerolineaceae bacterium]|jgi:MFS family permease